MKIRLQSKFGDKTPFVYWHVSVPTIEDFFSVDKKNTVLLEWLDRYSPPIMRAFRDKADKYLIRIACYLENIVDLYLPLKFDPHNWYIIPIDDYLEPIKLNILHSLFASVSCLSQGLFLQSGIIIRSITEDCLVLIDLLENDGQFEKLDGGTYSTTGLIKRVKTKIPKDIIQWYGYFSGNFAHFGPLHSAPYLPNACYSDNWVLVTGFQNFVRAVITLHITLEKIYHEQVGHHMFWDEDNEGELTFKENSQGFVWANELGAEIVKEFPPGERKTGFTYDSKSFKTK